MLHHVKLPKLVTDKYAGDISQWQYFCRQFETAVHQNPNLTSESQSCKKKKNVSDVKSFRYLHDDCEIQIHHLACMGVVSDTYGSMLCPILMELIPEEMTLEFRRQKDEDGVWKVEELVNFIRKEVDS